MTLLSGNSFGGLSAIVPSLPTGFQVFNHSVLGIFGHAPTIHKLDLENKNYPFAHEACVFMPSANRQDDKLFVTSIILENKRTNQKKIKTMRVVISENDLPYSNEINPMGVTMPNGGVNYANGLVFCLQGDMKTPGGLVFVDPEPPYESLTFVNDFQGKQFNSPNDVPHRDGSLWFTDPDYEYEQGFRPPRRLKPGIYRFDPKANTTNLMAGGLGKPNGIAFSPDQTTLYVTDTDRARGDGTIDESRASRM